MTENPGILYLVPTPIGNLQDMTFRAVKVLTDVGIIAAEDTRNSRILLDHYNITTPLTSYHKFNEREKSGFLLKTLKAGKDVAIVTDAGTPGISDPAEIIVKEAIKAEIEIICLPGATALIPALVVSGLSTKRFYFLGFFPEKKE